MIKQEMPEEEVVVTYREIHEEEGKACCTVL